jgi:hypothetical protein
MNRATFWTLFACTNLVLLFVKMYQHNVVVNLHYTKQKLEANIASHKLLEDNLLLTARSLSSHENLLAYSAESLKMKPVALSSIKKFSYIVGNSQEVF